MYYILLPTTKTSSSYPQFSPFPPLISSFCSSSPSLFSRQSHPEHTRNAPPTPTGSWRSPILFFCYPCIFAPSFERYGNPNLTKNRKETHNGKKLWSKHQNQWQGRLAALPPDLHGYLHQRAARQTSNSSSQHYYGRLRRPTPYYFLLFLRRLRRLTLPLALVGGRLRHPALPFPVYFSIMARGL